HRSTGRFKRGKGEDDGSSDGRLAGGDESTERHATSSLREKNTFLEMELKNFISLREQDIRKLHEHVAVYPKRNNTLIEDMSSLRALNRALGQANEAVRHENEALREALEESAKGMKELTDWNGQVSEDVQNIRQAFTVDVQFTQQEVGKVHRQVIALESRFQGLKTSMAQGFQSLGNMFTNADDTRSLPESDAGSAARPPEQHFAR
ncbi:hypothetical protein LZ30DRAFT_790544, partial [Colletotrichum cereale]